MFVPESIGSSRMALVSHEYRKKTGYIDFELASVTVKFLKIAATGNSWRRLARANIKPKLRRVPLVYIAVVRDPIRRFVAGWRSRYWGREASEIIGVLENASHETIDHHLRPCHAFIDALPKPPDIIHRFEDMWGDWRTLQQDYPDLPDLPRRRRKELLGAPETHLILTDKEIDRLSMFYRMDMERYGYGVSP